MDTYLDFLPNELLIMTDKFVWIGNEKLDYREIVLKELLEVVERAPVFKIYYHSRGKQSFPRLCHSGNWKWKSCGVLYNHYIRGDFYFECDVIEPDVGWNVWTLRTSHHTGTSCRGSVYIKCRKYKTTPECDWSYKMWPKTRVPFSKTKKNTLI